MPTGGYFGLFLRLLRQEGRRRRSIARRRRRHLRQQQRFEHFLENTRGRYGFGRIDGRRGRQFGGRRGRRFGGRRGRRGDGAGPSGAPLVMPEAQPPPAWILAGPAAPNLYADEEMEPAGNDMDINDPLLAAPPPPLPCPVHGWVCPRLAEQGHHVEEAAGPVAPAAASPPRSPQLPSPTPAHELVDAGTAPSNAGLGPRLPAPATVLGDVFDNGAGSSAAAAPRPHRRFRFIVRTGHRPTEANGLTNGHSNGVAPGTHLPGGSSSEEEDGAGGAAVPRR